MSGQSSDIFDRMDRRHVTPLILCLILSMGVHLALLLGWQGYGSGGWVPARLHATLRSMPTPPLPLPSPLPPGANSPADVPPAVPEPPGKASRQRAASSVSSSVSSSVQSGPVTAHDEGGGMQMSEYIPVELLDVKPHFLVDMNEYIPASLASSEAGRIIVQLLIGRQGDIDGVVVETSGLSAAGTRRFVQRIDALKVSPGQLEGQPVKCRWRMEFTFSPHG